VPTIEKIDRAIKEVMKATSKATKPTKSKGSSAK
jgi:hypothetical protein